MGELKPPRLPRTPEHLPAEEEVLVGSRILANPTAWRRIGEQIREALTSSTKVPEEAVKKASAICSGGYTLTGDFSKLRRRIRLISSLRLGGRSFALGAGCVAIRFISGNG